MRKLLLSLLLATGMAVPASVLAATPVLAQGCNTYTSDSPTWHVVRTGKRFTHAYGETVVRTLDACDTGTDHGSFVFPVNLQDADCSQYLQLGYGEGAEGGGLAWFWTPSATSCGAVYNTFTASFNPVVGRNYSFQIFPSAAYPDKWALRIIDIGSGAAAVNYVTKLTDRDTDEAWYGIEVKNLFDRFGGSSAANTVTLNDLRFRYVGDGGTYTYLTGTGGGAWANMDFLIPDSWHYSIAAGGAAQYTTLSGYDTSP